MTDLLDDEGVLAALNFRPPASPSHDVMCGGECGPCGGTGGVETYRCLHCGGSGRCQGCGFGAGYAAGAREVYNAVVRALRQEERSDG